MLALLCRMAQVYTTISLEPVVGWAEVRLLMKPDATVVIESGLGRRRVAICSRAREKWRSGVRKK
jgi:hypothetical protein